MKRILLIEDDDISQVFMADAIALLPATCICCTGFALARQLCQDTDFDLIISDVNAADGSLFDHVEFLPANCKKLAVSAEINPSITDRLMKIGMHDVLAKPMSILALHATLSRLLELNDTPTTPHWDKQKALLALGQNESILISLQAMFKAELPLMMKQIQHAFEHQQHNTIRDELHKLKASCGFLGANRLLNECVRLDAEISAQNVDRFMDVAKQTLALI